MNRSLIVFLVIALGLSGCTTKKASQIENQPIEITFWHVLGSPFDEVLNPMIAEFNAQHPKILVKSVTMGNYTALSQKLMASVAAGAPPTIAQSFESWTANLVETGAIVPVDSLIRTDPSLATDYLDSFDRALMQTCYFQDRLWSLPFNKSVRALFYNQDLFDQAGIDSPPTNWIEYYEYAKRLTQDTNNDGVPEIYGTAGKIDAWTLLNLIYQHGGVIFDSIRYQFQDEHGIAALAFLDSLIGKGSKVGYLTSGYDFQNDFLAGKVAMIEGSTVTKIFIKDRHSFRLGVAPIPQGLSFGNCISGTNIVIFKNQNQLQVSAAWEFIKWFTATEQTARWSAGTSYLPVKDAAYNQPIMQEYFTDNHGMEAVFAQVNQATFEPNHSSWYPCRDELEKSMEQVLRGVIEPEDALLKAYTQCQIKLP